MKAGDLFMVQYSETHSSFRVLPLRTCTDLAKQAFEKGEEYGWVVLDYAATDSEAYDKMKKLKELLKTEGGSDDGDGK